MMKKLSIIFFLCIAVLPISGLPIPSFNTVDTAALDQILTAFDTAGLDQILVTFFFQDSKGFIWIGSENGLHRYDGRKTRSFQYDYRDENSLSHNYVSSVVDCGDGSLWIGTAGGGVCRFDGNTGKCKRYVIDRSEMSNRNFVTDLLITRRGELVVSTLDGMFYFNEEEDRFEGIPNGKVSGQFIVRTMIEIDEEILMMGTVKGLEFMDLDGHKFLDSKYCVNLEEEISVFSFLKSSDGNILIGADGAVFVFDPEKKKIVTFDQYYGTDLPVRNSICYSILEKDNTLYMGTGKGLIVKSQSNRINHFMKDSAVTALFIDRSGVFWIGDYYNGVKTYSVFKSRFIEKDFINRFVENRKVTVSAFEESDGYYWVGTTKEGLYQIDKINGHFVHIQVNKPRPRQRLGDHHVRSLVLDQDNTLWIGTSKGLKYLKEIDLDKGSLKVESAGFNLTSFNISYLFFDSSGLFWVGTQKGLNCIDTGNNSVRYFTSSPDSENSLTSDWITVVTEDDHGEIWIGTLNGLNKYTKSKGKMVSYKADPDDPGSLSFNDITDIIADSGGRVWVGTWCGGLNYYIRDKDQFKTFSTNDGLLSNSIMGIQSGSNGDIWISTTVGISKYDRVGDIFENYSKLDGLKTLNYFYQSKFRARSGKLYFFGYQGVGIVNEKRMEKNSYIPEVVITSIKSGSENLKSNRISIPDKQKISFSHRDKNFVVKFAALDYNIPGKNQYAYRISPIDEENEWHFIGNENKIAFFKLPDGTNRIYVKGTNSDGIWNEEPTWVDIEIIPPFWRTTWFRILVGLLLILIIYILFRLRLRMMIRKMESDAKLDYFCKKHKISSREKDILELLIQGKSNKEIEDLLFISSNTVRNHVYNIYQKLGIQKRVQLLKLFEVTRAHSPDES